MNEEQLRKYHKNYVEICNDFWSIIKEFSNPTNDDEFWQSLKERAQELCDKDKSSKLRRAMIREAVLEIHRLWKKEQ